MKELQRAVADSNPEAEDLIERLLQGIGEDSAAYQPLIDIKEFLDSYNFADAATRLEALDL